MSRVEAPFGSTILFFQINALHSVLDYDFFVVVWQTAILVSMG
jgi:hypothetical protein